MARNKKIRRVSFIPEQLENFERAKKKEQIENLKIEIPFEEINKEIGKKNQDEFDTKKFAESNFKNKNEFSIAEFLNKFGINFFDNFPTISRRRSTISASSKEERKRDEIFNRVICGEQIDSLENFCNELENEVASLRNRSAEIEGEINRSSKIAKNIFLLNNEETKGILIFLRKYCRNQAKSGVLKLSILEQEKYNEKLSLKRNILRREYEKEDAENYALKDAIEKSKGENEKIKNCLHNLRKMKNIENLTGESIEEIKNKNKNLKKNYEKLMQENKFLEGEIERKSKSVQNQREERNILEKEIFDLQRELNKKSIEPSELNKIKEYFNGTIQSIDLSIDSFKNGVSIAIEPFSLKLEDGKFLITDVKKEYLIFKNILPEKMHSTMEILKFSLYFDVLKIMHEKMKIPLTDLQKLKGEEIFKFFNKTF